MDYALQMGSGAMIYIPSFIQICSGIQKLTGGGNGFTDTQTALRSHKPTLVKQANKDPAPWGWFDTTTIHETNYIVSSSMVSPPYRGGGGGV
jgi:hypothetical protein